MDRRKQYDKAWIQTSTKFTRKDDKQHKIIFFPRFEFNKTDDQNG